MTTRIYLARHGETVLNREKKYFGKTDCALTDEGRLQAESLGKKLKDLNINIEAVYSSPLVRAVETTQIVLKAVGFECDVRLKSCNVTYDENLEEINFGEWEAFTAEDLRRDWPRDWEKWCNDWINFTPPSGESFNAFYRRVSEAFNNILTQNLGKNILIISHLGCMRVILSSILGLREEGTWRFSFTHDGLTIIEDVDGYKVLKFMNI